MSNRSGLLCTSEPANWIDHNGKKWPTLRIIGRIKYRYPAAHALREFVFQRDNFTCADCGTTDQMTLLLDHIVSRRCGGSHHPRNLRTLCDRCNSRKVGLVDVKRPAWTGEQWAVYFASEAQAG